MSNNIYDIYSIKEVSIFPLAPGYYYIICLLAISALVFFLYKKFRAKEKWQKTAKNNIKIYLENKNSNQIDLYLLIKKITMLKFGRNNTAKLSGNKLLLFLDKHDPHNYRWSKKAKFINNIYQKESSKDKIDIDDILKNLKKWL